MITYSDLYEALRKEKYSEQLQKLPKSFFDDTIAYIKEKESIAKKTSDTFSETTRNAKKQLENVFVILHELLLRRKKKLLNLALLAAEIGISKRDSEKMLKPEQELFTQITKKIKELNKHFDNMLAGKKEKELKNQLVRFRQDTAKFLDLNGIPLGPFKKGDVANLPKEIVNILKQDKKVTEIETE